MKIGLRLPQTGKNRATRENIIQLAQEAEDAGFHSLWVLERLEIWRLGRTSCDQIQPITAAMLLGGVPFLRRHLNAEELFGSGSLNFYALRF